MRTKGQQYMSDSMPIPGLYLTEHYLSEAEANAVVRQLDMQPWMTQLRRRVQHYGFIYDYKRRRVGWDMHLGDLPDWLRSIAVRLHGEGIFVREPDQCIVNEYEPGQGISPHVDCEPCFGKVIASISLLSPCVMTFSHLERPYSVTQSLLPGSLLVMTGEARYKWKHGIPARKSDTVDGETWQRSRRISITFREVIVKPRKS